MNTLKSTQLVRLFDNSTYLKYFQLFITCNQVILNKHDLVARSQFGKSCKYQTMWLTLNCPSWGYK